MSVDLCMNQEVSTHSRKLPSVDEVLGKFNQSSSYVPDDPKLRHEIILVPSLKAEHLKKRGDDAIKQGNYREAKYRYTEAIDLQPSKDLLKSLYSNRSLAHIKCQNFTAALKDADLTCELAPRWSKAHWRRGAALVELKRTNEAVKEYLEAWKLSNDEPECANKLWQVVQMLTREQLAAGFLELFSSLQTQGLIEPATKEEVSEQELTEAFFRLITQTHQGTSRPGPMYYQYLEYVTTDIKPYEAYTLRSAVYTKFKCYLQARADAHAAIRLLAKDLLEARQMAEGSFKSETASKEVEHGEKHLKSLKHKLAAAYLRLGQAYLAEQEHLDRNCFAAFKALRKGIELWEGCEGLKEGLEQASEHLTTEQLERAYKEVYHEGIPGLGTSSTSINTSLKDTPKHIFAVRVRLVFPSARPSMFSARPRELLRASLAEFVNVAQRCVTLERAFPWKRTLFNAQNKEGEVDNTAKVQEKLNQQVVFRIDLTVEVGSEILKGNKLAKAFDSSLHNNVLANILLCIGGHEIIELLGPLDVELSGAELEDVTPKCVVSDVDRAAHAVIEEEGGDVSAEDDKRIALPSRPKLDIELPYRQYKLVRSNGSAIERTDKHPFCMSRVYYDAGEKPEATWAEMADGSCRWRQTGSEILIQALKVPSDLPPRHLAVTFQPYSLKVANKHSGEVYLEGDLERGIIPHDCFWTHCGGSGEDGCLITLYKMNLEVLQKHWMHSEMWWPKLFRHHGEIAWDDYEKDYSDLPELVLEKHRKTEAIKDVERKIEQGEKDKREILQERDDLRKRNRQERLHELRSGVNKSWVQLQYE